MQQNTIMNSYIADLSLYLSEKCVCMFVSALVFKKFAVATRKKCDMLHKQICVL